MKVWIIVTVSLLLPAAMGCKARPAKLQSDRAFDAWLTTSFRDTAINRAIISQATLFPYHFVPNATELNGLGEHDLGVLGQHFRKHPGNLNIRQGDVATELYETRVEAVVETLSKAGVEASRMTVSDALPGGDGISSEDLLIILKARAKKLTAGDTGTAQSGS